MIEGHRESFFSGRSTYNANEDWQKKFVLLLLVSATFYVGGEKIMGEMSLESENVIIQTGTVAKCVRAQASANH